MVATHDLAQARAWDQVLCLNRRQIAFGTPAEVLARGAGETYGGAIVLIGEDRQAVLPAHHH